MKERPILFSAPMVRALLAGTKTQTRRVVKPMRGWGERFPICKPEGMAAGHEVWWWDGEFERVGVSQSCPYGVPGDRLWVREAWSFIGQQGIFDLNQAMPGNCKPIYRADGGESDRWWPSIHMPRWASRLTLQITDVRVERLNDISEADAMAEGVYRVDPDAADIEAGCTPDDFVFMAPGVRQGWGMNRIERARDQWWPTAAGAYRLVWDHINGPGSWAANPWVWAVSFEVQA